MKALLSLGSLALIVTALASTQTSASSSTAITKEHTIHVINEPVNNKHHIELVTYILNAMKQWAPASTIIRSHNTDRFPSIADDIVTVVLDPTEPSLFHDDPSKLKTAVLLATVAYFEGHFWEYVEDGTCNASDRSNPILKNGPCDGGTAYSLWQIHPEHGLVLLNNTWGYSTHNDSINVITGEKLLADRKLSAKTALHFLRASLNRNGTLCEYTGEHKECPKAKARLDFANAWVKAHAS